MRDRCWAAGQADPAARWPSVQWHAPELERYIAHVARIQPREVQICPNDRRVADSRLVRVPRQRLQEIARRGEAATGVPFRAFWA